MMHIILKRQHEFTKGKLCLTNSIIFHDKAVICLADVGLVEGIVYLDFSKALTVVFHSLPLENLVSWGLGKSLCGDGELAGGQQQGWDE